MSRSSRPLFDIITIGDTMLDIFFDIHEANLSCQKKPGSCLLCMEYGEKIPVQAVTHIAGAGNASNAAIGARRLGMKSGIVTILGKDRTADDILRTWRREGVQTKYVKQDAAHETSLAGVLQFQGDRTILLYNQPRTYQLPPLPPAQWIYYTALGPKHERLERELLRYLKQHPDTRLLFNPGPHQIRRGLESLGPIINRSDVFIVNKEEAARILGTESSPAELINGLLQHGAKQIVITDGPAGAWGGDAAHIWNCPIFPGPIKERTGAGDSFATAVLYGLASGHSLNEALRYGTANAWSVVQKTGPHEGLLSHAQLATVLKKFKRIQSNLIR